MKRLTEQNSSGCPSASSTVGPEGRFPGHTARDPFDHILSAQALLENLPLITSDLALADVGVKVLW
jgi:PIN domain nuclease of toxin-antitoxin system